MRKISPVEPTTPGQSPNISTQIPHAAQSVPTKDNSGIHFDEIFNEIKQGIKKEVTFDNAITLEDLNAFIMQIQAENLKLDMLTARNITFSENNKVSLPSPNVASYWVEFGSGQTISNLEGSTAKAIKVLNKKTVTQAELNALLFDGEPTPERPSIAPAPQIHFAKSVIFNGQDITAQLPQSNSASAGGIRFGGKVTINAKRVTIDGQEFSQQAAATAQPQHQPAQQQEQVAQPTEGPQNIQTNIATPSPANLQKSAVEAFLQNPSIAKSAYWQGKIVANVTVQEIFDHVDGKHKGKFFSYSGKDTKKVLEEYGVNFTHLVSFTGDKKINYLCEKINSAPHAIPAPAKK
ncbi:MAG: hypothetical protein A3E82_05440 [Gammaproteobacteria bacterium RIFCSPHIGHO2_12_FULL_38_11]|nr:MAG: hypothetical protein A3E82_05440 [Gammaproteobacteria bacterium RIFCSPHIGHO2_12_FULL_38_11]